METFAPKTVREAAVFLDRNLPGWEKYIDLPNLDMATCESCVLGQLWRAHPALAGRPLPEELTGLYNSSYDAALRVLGMDYSRAFGSNTDEKWAKAVKARLNQPPVRDLAPVDA